MDTQTRRIAVLIDADNASAGQAAAVFEEVAKHGEANIRRIYGDFSQQRLKGWVDQMLPLAITARFERAFTTGKNAADIALVIDAMDLMHTGVVDTFCLVTSDSDFTGLAKRLRENDKLVLGFGERKTPDAFRNACNRFIYVENLGLPANGKPDAQEAAATEAAEARKERPSEAGKLIIRAMTNLEDDEGWVMLGALGNQLQKIAPDFDPRNYGLSKLSEVVREAGEFELDKTDGGHLKARRRRARKGR